MKPGSLFSDGVVMQQNHIIRVWGTTLPGLLIEAVIADKKTYAKSSTSGEFLLRIPAMKAGGPSA